MTSPLRSALLLLSVASTAAAGPELGLNLSGVRDYASEYPFVDVMRSARPWVSQRQGAGWGQGGPLELSDAGYPLHFATGQYATTIVLNARGFPSGTYVCTYRGQGTLKFKGDVKVVAEQPGRIELAVGQRPNVLVDLTATDPADPLRDLHLYMPGTEATAVKQPFSEPFLDRCRRFSCLRFMDWMNTNNSKQSRWEDRPKTSDFTWAVKGVPVEVMIALAEATETDPWFCMPHLADDEYVRQFAELVDRELDRSHAVYVEHSNEVWNGQFQQAKDSAERGKPLSDNRYQGQLLHHAKRSGEIFDAWNQRLGEDRVIGVLGSQSVNPWVTEQVLSEPSVAAAADAVAIAPYFGGRLGDPKRQREVAAMTVEQVVAECERAIRENAAVIREQARRANAKGLRLIAYEGGQHLVGHGGAENNGRLMDLFHAVNRDPAMERLYRESIESWQASGGDLFVVFSSVSVPSKWGSWGMIEYEGQPESETPKWRAIKALTAE